MRIEHDDEKQVSILMSEDEARHLLASLERHHEDLGEAGGKTQQALTDLGVEPHKEPQHRRYEF